MKIKKHGHCCFIAEPVPGVRIMTDPGMFSSSQNEERNIAAIVITHEHGDHLHVESVEAVLAGNPGAVVITNSAVAKILADKGIECVKVEDKESYDLKGVKITGFGSVHAEVYESYGQVQNTGYMIGGLCFPGDNFEMPEGKADILALPVAGPWMRIKDAITYAKALHPRVAFPVHDAILAPAAKFLPKMAGQILAEDNIDFQMLELGQEQEV